MVPLHHFLRADSGPVGTQHLPVFGNDAFSKWAKKKTFPSNVEICVELAVSRQSPPGSFEKKLVHYSFWELKKTDYKTRIADDRIGYFLTTNRAEAEFIMQEETPFVDGWGLCRGRFRGTTSEGTHNRGSFGRPNSMGHGLLGK